MDKNEVVLQLTLKLLDNFKYNVEEYRGNTLLEHAEYVAEYTAKIFNELYKNIEC